jgi:lipopolysaccharide transport system ATP-binding protein
VDRFIDTPVKHYSSGMQMRLALRLPRIQPNILLVDEVLAVGDQAFHEVSGKMATSPEAGGRC